MKMLHVSMLVLGSPTVLGLHLTHAQEHASEKPRKSREVDRDSYVETKWVAEVVGSESKVDERLGVFATYDEAEDACQEWSRKHPRDLRLTRTREVRYRVRPPRPRAAKKREEGPPLNASQRPVPKAQDPARFAGTWVDATVNSRFQLGRDGSVRWTIDDPTAVTRERTGIWRTRDDGSLEIVVDQGWLIVQGAVQDGVLRGNSRNRFAPQWGTSDVELRLKEPARPIAEKARRQADRKSEPTAAAYRLKYPVNADGRLRIEVKGQYATLAQAMEAGRRLQATTEYNVLVIDAARRGPVAAAPILAPELQLAEPPIRIIHELWPLPSFSPATSGSAPNR